MKCLIICLLVVALKLSFAQDTLLKVYSESYHGDRLISTNDIIRNDKGDALKVLWSFPGDNSKNQRIESRYDSISRVLHSETFRDGKIQLVEDYQYKGDTTFIVTRGENYKTSTVKLGEKKIVESENLEFAFDGSVLHKTHYWVEQDTINKREYSHSCFYRRLNPPLRKNASSHSNRNDPFSIVSDEIRLENDNVQHDTLETGEVMKLSGCRKVDQSYNENGQPLTVVKNFEKGYESYQYTYDSLGRNVLTESFSSVDSSSNVSRTRYEQVSDTLYRYVSNTKSPKTYLSKSFHVFGKEESRTETHLNYEGDVLVRKMTITELYNSEEYDKIVVTIYENLRENLSEDHVNFRLPRLNKRIDYYQSFKKLNH
ncbi:MAG: hypothetical protein ACFHU9_08180 [Fluviicola sp.]